MTNADLIAALKSAKQFRTPLSPEIIDRIIKALGGKS